MATINDICKLANVSKATVSRVMNGTAQVKSETKERVELAMKALNYRPNSLAQALASNRSNSIGIILSDFDGDYFGAMMKHAAKIADQTNKQLIVTDGHNSEQREIESIKFLASRRCDVIIIYSREIKQTTFDRIQKEIKVPIVLVGQSFSDSGGYTLAMNQYQIATKAMQHLIDSGHKKIGYLGPVPNTHTKKVRLQAYQDHMQKGNLVNFICSPFLSEGFRHHHGYKTANEHIASIKKLDALFIASDDLALGCYRALHENNILIPNDISIVSIDNTEKSQFIYPPLTTVSLPINELTEKALEIAIKLAKDEKLIKHHFVFSGKLIQRGSVLKNLINNVSF